jgi:Na+-driven multidrug efflux pump
VIRIPLGWLAARHLGLDGIVLVIATTCVVRAVILVLWFRRNAWQRTAVLT